MYKSDYSASPRRSTRRTCPGTHRRSYEICHRAEVMEITNTNRIMSGGASDHSVLYFGVGAYIDLALYYTINSINSVSVLALATPRNVM